MVEKWGPVLELGDPWDPLDPQDPQDLWDPQDPRNLWGPWDLRVPWDSQDHCTLGPPGTSGNQDSLEITSTAIN